MFIILFFKSQYSFVISRQFIWQSNDNEYTNDFDVTGSHNIEEVNEKSPIKSSILHKTENETLNETFQYSFFYLYSVNGSALHTARFLLGAIIKKK